jgi:broad specificity phosphatase PhoE
VQQAETLGRSDLFRENCSFWRMYSSDLARAEDTARIILRSAAVDATELRLDTRLRELAKGARQGYPKTLSYNQAVQNRQEQGHIGPIPKLESEEDGWLRVASWLDEVLTDAVAEDDMRNRGQLCGKKSYNVLVVAHAGLLRVFLKKMLGKERLNGHPCATHDADGRFRVPNTSVTILDIYAEAHKQSTLSKFEGPTGKSVNIVQLTRTTHLDDHALLLL